MAVMERAWVRRWEERGRRMAVAVAVDGSGGGLVVVRRVVAVGLLGGLGWLLVRGLSFMAACECGRVEQRKEEEEECEGGGKMGCAWSLRRNIYLQVGLRTRTRSVNISTQPFFNFGAASTDSMNRVFSISSISLWRAHGMRDASLDMMYRHFKVPVARWVYRGQRLKRKQGRPVKGQISEC